MPVVWVPSHDEIIGFQYIVFWDDTRELRRPEVQFLDVAGLPHRTTSDVRSGIREPGLRKEQLGSDVDAVFVSQRRVFGKNVFAYFGFFSHTRVCVT